MIKVASTQFCGRSAVTRGAKFQLVSCNLSLAMIWQMTYSHILPKLCSATLITDLRNYSIFHFMFTLGPLTASQKTSFANAQKFLEHPCFDNTQTFKQWFQESHRKSLEVAGMFLENICQSKQDKKCHTYWPKTLVCIINHWASEGQSTEAFFSGRCSLRGMAVLVGRAK